MVGLFFRKRYIEPTACSRLLNMSMWQHSQTSLRWVPAALTLGLLVACSPPAQNQVSETPNPIAAQPDVSPMPTASAIAPPKSNSSPPVPVSQSKPSIASASAKQPQAPIAAAPAAKPLPLERTPTFRATPRMAGFSPDGNYFIYLESSRDTGAGVPKSALQLVNIESNRCVDNGCIETRYGEKDARTETAEAETDLLKQTWKVRQELNLTPPVAGTDVPILSRSRAVDGSETVTIRLSNSTPLKLHLQQKSTQDKASMQLGVTYNGQQRSLDSLNNFRDNVLDYSLRQVKLSPDGKRIAVLITTTKPTFEGTLGTTLVQGFAL
jgi:predicted secreted protein